MTCNEGLIELLTTCIVYVYKSSLQLLTTCLRGRVRVFETEHHQNAQTTTTLHANSRTPPPHINILANTVQEASRPPPLTHGMAVHTLRLRGALQCVAVNRCVSPCRSVPQCVAVCCSVLQCPLARWPCTHCGFELRCSVSQCVTVCRAVPQRVSVCCNMLQCGAVCGSVLQCPLSR